MPSWVQIFRNLHIICEEPWKHIYVTEDPNSPSSNQVIVLAALLSFSYSGYKLHHDSEFVLDMVDRSTQNISSLIP